MVDEELKRFLKNAAETAATASELATLIESQSRDPGVRSML